jgi:hypothetical protein
LPPAVPTNVRLPPPNVSGDEPTFVSTVLAEPVPLAIVTVP